MITQLNERHIVIKLILDPELYPSGVDRNGKAINEKIIRANNSNTALTVNCVINKPAGFMQSSATATIYGMSMIDIDTFQKLNQTDQDKNIATNIIEIYAGYELNQDGMPPLTYRGGIYAAAPNFNDSSRSRPFTITSLYGWELQNIFAPMINIKGKILLNTLFETIANNFNGLAYLPLNVDNVYVENPIFTGSPIEQLEQATSNYGYQYKLDDTFLLVTKKGMPFYDTANANILTLRKENGLLGYPQPVALAWAVRSRFNPLIKFGMKINVVSGYEAATSSWYINGLIHNLQTHGPQFETTLLLNSYRAIVE